MASPMDPNDALLLAQLAEQQRANSPAEPLLDVAAIFGPKPPAPPPPPPSPDELEAAAAALAADEVLLLGRLAGTKIERALAELASLGEAVTAYRAQRAAAWDKGVRGISPAAVDEALITLASHPGAEWIAEQVRDMAGREAGRAAREAEQERILTVRRYWFGQVEYHGLGRSGTIAAVDPETRVAYLAGSPEWEAMTHTPHAEALELVAGYRRHLATCEKCGGLQ